MELVQFTRLQILIFTRTVSTTLSLVLHALPTDGINSRPHSGASDAPSKLVVKCRERFFRKVKAKLFYEQIL